MHDVLIATGTIYTIAQVKPTFSMTWAWHGLVRLHLQSGPDLKDKFDFIIAPNGHLSPGPQLCVPHNR